MLFCVHLSLFKCSASSLLLLFMICLSVRKVHACRCIWAIFKPIQVNLCIWMMLINNTHIKTHLSPSYVYLSCIYSIQPLFILTRGAQRFCRELWFTMLCLLSIIHSLWFLSNLSLIILVQLKRQSEFLLHHQYHFQLISICVHYHVPFGFSSVSIKIRIIIWTTFVHLCVYMSVLLSDREP